MTALATHADPSADLAVLELIRSYACAQLFNYGPQRVKSQNLQWHSYLEPKHNRAQTFRTINTGTHLFREKTYGTQLFRAKDTATQLFRERKYWDIYI